MKQLVLFNAGLKSLFLAELARREGEVLLCYLYLWQEKGFEIRMINRAAKEMNLPLVVVSLSESPSLKEAMLRLLYLVLMALPTAQKYKCKKIIHGISADDGPWGRADLDTYLEDLSRLINQGQPLYDAQGFWLGDIELETPLRQIKRNQVIRLGNRYDCKWQLSHSCLEQRLVHCGKCKGCKGRLNAFAQEHYEDPAIYVTK